MTDIKLSNEDLEKLAEIIAEKIMIKFKQEEDEKIRRNISLNKKTI
ncbi:MAG: hypothetical protein ACOCV1_00660 [Bacillota bacterium]